MARVDFFISYAGADRTWAEWVGWHLEAAGFTVELDVWDWNAGDNAPRRMSDAVANAGAMIALFSPDYFGPGRHTLDEWSAVMAQRPGDRRRLIPLRIGPVDPPSLLAPLIWHDLYGRSEDDARDVLLTAARGAGRRPTAAPPFPAGGGQADARAAAGGEPAASSHVPKPRVPGSRPSLWKVPHRNPAFTGRETLLAAVRERLCAGDRALVQAVHGMGGVGKSQLAVEYAHLFAGAYDLVWWIDAEVGELIGEQLAELGTAAGWVRDGTVTAAAARETVRRLSASGGWLLIFDNVPIIEDVIAWLPSGTGHVVVTSRSGKTGGVAVPVGVDVFDRAESVALLCTHLPVVDPCDADRLAAALGDLPLALAQAAGLLGETGMSVDEYLDELAGHAGRLLSDAPAPGYPMPLGAVVTTSVRRLSDVDTAAVRLLHVCAMLAAEPVPIAWFAGAPPGTLDEPLASAAGARLALRRTLGRLTGMGLARSDTDTVQVHRLIQAVVRDAAGADAGRTREQARRLVAAAAPTDEGADPGRWADWAQLLPHVLALDPMRSDTLFETLRHALAYLNARGEYRTVLDLATQWHRHRRTVDGPDDARVLAAATTLAVAHRYLGHSEQARALTEDALTRYRRVLGNDHPDTMRSAGNLAADLRRLGRVDEARSLNEDTFARYRRVLGDDHPDTMRAAANLAADLRALGDAAAGRGLDADTFERRRRVLGDDHPDTLRSAGNLAADLRELGDHAAARRLNEDTLARYRRVLGDDHPATLRAAGNLAADLRALGAHATARPLVTDTLERYRRTLGDDHPGTRWLAALADELR
ncbi:FxSxx-COOH system tetratricopeptide repeat protein [Virgisporangium aurantiacum]|uniref:ATP-binding protein n=1 Tax=Virgisporangium aurantiacum TaxID=175570 RepID=A0A8J3ZJI0_9ACTN|nr:FxSxx-COOH system tetratricopeptide repeat protein [Virgisporangium aurantiacum]GIJ62603.1 ATP-binding protein [Virgisporangium aurantiacum]